MSPNAWANTGSAIFCNLFDSFDVEQLIVRGLTFKTVISGGAIDPMELTSCRQSLSFLAGSGSVRIAGVCEEIIR